MLGALLSAPGSPTWGVGSVVQDEMCVPLQVIFVVVPERVCNIRLIGIERDVEDAVICFRMASLRYSFGSPLVARVAPRT
jgi:hypothetical protein